MPCRSLQEPIGSYARSCKRRALAHHVTGSRGPGRRAGAVTRKPEDLPAIASLFPMDGMIHWDGQPGGDAPVREPFGRSSDDVDP